MRREVFAAISVIGVVFTFLFEFVSEDREMAATALLATCYLLGFLFLLSEYRFYRSENALLASLQFLAIPILLLTVGNILAPLGYETGFIEFSINFILSVEAIASYASLVLLLPIISILRLTARYYDGRYPGFVIRRSRYGNFILPFFIHLISIVLVIATSVWLEIIDLFALAYVVLSVGQIVQKIILPPITNAIGESRPSRRGVSSNRERRSFLNSIRGRDSSRSRRNSGSSRSSRSRSSIPSSSTSSRRSNRNRTREVSTAPSDGYREIPTRSRSSSPRSSRGSSNRSSSRSSNRSRTRPAPSRSVAEVDRGIEAVTPSKPKRVKKGKVSDYLPKGNFDASDLQCVICYSDFSEKSRQNIVICPSCKFPGHEVEFLSWLNSSTRCPRCNKVISGKGSLKSGRVSEAQYAKFIRKL